MEQRLIIVTAPFVLAYPNLWEPRKWGNGLTPRKYTACAMWDSVEQVEGIKVIQEIVKAESRERFGLNSDFRNPLRQGPLLKELDLSRYTVLNLHSTLRPLIKENLAERGIYTANKETFYSGCICAAEITPYSYNFRGHKGVAFQLLAITKIGESKLTPAEAEAFSVPII